MMSKPSISPETQQTAMAVAKANQKPGQTKEQTKLIAQGIEKGIAEFKKQQKAKARERSKQQKKQHKTTTDNSNISLDTESELHSSSKLMPSWLPWTLLILSWVGFLVYALM